MIEDGMLKTYKDPKFPDEYEISINEDFNTKSFVSFYDHGYFDQMIEYIIELDNNIDKYLEMLKTPWFIDNIIPTDNKIDNIKKNK